MFLMRVPLYRSTHIPDSKVLMNLSWIYAIPSLLRTETIDRLEPTLRRRFLCANVDLDLCDCSLPRTPI